MASPSLKEPAPDSVIFSFSAFLLSGMLHAPPLTVCSGLASKVKRIVELAARPAIFGVPRAPLRLVVPNLIMPVRKNMKRAVPVGWNVPGVR